MIASSATDGGGTGAPDAIGTERLDVALAARGLARSRTHAQRLVAAGDVTVDGRVATKPSEPVHPHTNVAVRADDPWVSRGALKLVHALDAFGVDPTARLGLDLGASTGGFTQVLLARGARRVVALDVGHDQLVPELAGDDRVVVVEGENARDLTAARFAELIGDDERPTVVTGDLSFISLTLVLPAIAAVAHPDADVLLLVKPQFEVGRVRDGVVRDPALRTEAIRAVLDAAWAVGLGAVGLAASPIAGTTGNHEYLVHLRAAGGRDPGEWTRHAAELAGTAPDPATRRPQTRRPE